MWSTPRSPRSGVSPPDVVVGSSTLHSLRACSDKSYTTDMRPPVDKPGVPCIFEDSGRAHLAEISVPCTRANKTYLDEECEASIAPKCRTRYNCARSMAASSGALLNPSPSLGARAVPVSSSLAIWRLPPTTAAYSTRHMLAATPEPNTPVAIPVSLCPWAVGQAILGPRLSARAGTARGP
jgi:hypothetical protein